MLHSLGPDEEAPMTDSGFDLTRRAALGVLSGALAAVAARAEEGKMQIGENDILIVVDVQNDFLPGGSLAVPKGDEVIAPINALAKKFAHVIMTQDWHTPRHASFASTHSGKHPFEMIALRYGNQVLWPDHCVQGSRGAALADALDIPKAELIIRKGYRQDTDSYSAFNEADRRPTGLAGYLKERGFKRVFCAGLATDFCVAWTAQDARGAGFYAVVIEDASRGIDNQGSLAAAWDAMARAGVQRITSAAIA
jgi:nicotinamidase/pyrazinamidase